MSATAVLWAATPAMSGRMPARERLLLVALAGYANSDGHAWPGVDRLARELGWTARTVQRGLRRLEAHDVITPDPDAPVDWHRPQSHPVPYRLDLTAAPARVVPRGDRNPETVTAGRGDSLDRSGVTKLSPEPRTEISTKPLPLPAAARSVTPKTVTPKPRRSAAAAPRTPPTCPTCQLLHYANAACDGPPVLVSVPTSKPRRPYRGNRWSATAGRRKATG